MINVMVVDDDRLMRAGIYRILHGSGDISVVAEAENGEEAQLRARTHKLDAVLMDINMPGIGGIEATHRLLRSNPQLKVIGLSMYVDSVYPALLLQAGASGYVSKNAFEEELINAIKDAVAGKNYLSRDVAMSLLRSGGSDDNVGALDRLSQRERQVMQMICSGYCINEIAEKLSRSPNTISGHRRRLLAKLKVQNDVQLVRIAERLGMERLSDAA